MRRRLLAVAGLAGLGVLAGLVVRKRSARKGQSRAKVRFERGIAAVNLVARGGARYASSAPKLFAAAGEARQQLRQDLALETAQDVAETLGAMKGVLMKIGQMASYIDEGLSPAVRRTLSRSRTASRR